MTPNPLRDLILGFYTDLEQLERGHPDLTEPDVAEALHLTLNRHFVWGRAVERLPVTYRLFSLAGDRALGRLVASFLERAVEQAEEAGIEVGRPRLACLQDDDLITPGGHRYDEYLGSTDRPRPDVPLPEDLFQSPRGRMTGWGIVGTLLAILLGVWALWFFA